MNPSTPTPTTITERQTQNFWKKVEKPTAGTNSCWTWKGAKTQHGYGVFGVGTKRNQKSTAHRVAYRLVKGEIPTGLELDHLCRNRACVNPDHLGSCPVECVTDRAV